MTIPSAPPTQSKSSSLFWAKHKAPSSYLRMCTATSLTHLYFLRSQNRKLPSWPHDTSYNPSGRKRTEVTESECAAIYFIFLSKWRVNYLSLDHRSGWNDPHVQRILSFAFGWTVSYWFENIVLSIKTGTQSINLRFKDHTLLISIYSQNLKWSEYRPANLSKWEYLLIYDWSTTTTTPSLTIWKVCVSGQH